MSAICGALPAHPKDCRGRRRLRWRRSLAPVTIT